MEFFDTHSHYNDEKFNDDLDEMIENTYNAGITKFTCIGYNLESSKKAIEIAKKYNYIYASVGISPNDITENFESELEEIKQIAENNRVVAIGEIGLDYYWNKDNKELQKQVFKKQIDFANELDLPIIIHTRDASIDTIDVLKNNLVKNMGIFHCCPFNRELIKEALKLGFYISFSGNVTFKNAKPELAVNEVPLDRLLIETDSPYLTPEPYRGTRNDSIKVKEVAKKIADLKQISLEDLAKITYENAMRVYKISL